MMNTTVNPFSYNSHSTSGYNYKRLDPSTFWNPSINFVKRSKKKKLNNNDETFKKVVRNVKNLPEHLIGRFKHNKENSRKSKARLFNFHPFKRTLSGCSFLWAWWTWSASEDQIRKAEVNFAWKS